MKSLKHPYEYLAAQVFFADKMSRLLRISLPSAMIKYTDLFMTLVQRNKEKEEDEGNYSRVWLDFIQQIQKIKDLKTISDILFNEFTKQARSYIEIVLPERPKHYDSEYTFGCFTINWCQENREKNQIRLHFEPLRMESFEKEEIRKVSDLATIYQAERTAEFKTIVKFIKDNLFQDKEIKYLLSSTWLQNIPNYQRLFPKKYSLTENRQRINDSYLGIWGQFERWNDTGNSNALAQFKSNLLNAKTEIEVRNAYPNPIFEIRVPLNELFDYYLV
jgi:hypothetical protein